MMRVALIAYTILSVDARLLRYVSALEEARIKTDVFVLNEDTSRFNDYQYINIIAVGNKYSGANRLRYVFSYVLFFLKVFTLLSWRHLFKHKYDVVHTNNLPDFIVFSALIPKISGSLIIHDIHDLMPEVYLVKAGKRGFYYKLMLILEGMAARFADILIFTQQFHREMVLSRHHLQGKPAEVILNCADPSAFKPIDLSNMIFSPQMDFTFVYHGTLAERLGVDNVIRAMQKVVQQLPSVRLRVLGEGDFLETLVRLAEELNVAKNVSFSKRWIPSSEIPKILSQCHAGVLGTKKKNQEYGNYMLPVKLMEYAALGLPTVCPRLKEIEAYFDEEMLLYYEPDDIDDLAEKMLRLASNRQLWQQYHREILRFTRVYNWPTEERHYVNLLHCRRY